MSLTALGALRRLHPDRYLATLRHAVEDADGRIPDAAHALGITARHLYRLLRDKRLRGLQRAPVGVHR